MVVIFVLMGIWLFGQVLTDIYRGTEAVDWMRGDAGIVFFAVDLACLAALLERNDRRKVVFLTGCAIGSLLSVRFQPTESTDVWKFGYSFGTILIVILLSCYFFGRRRYMITGLLFAGITLVNLLFNYRSPVLFLLIVSVLVLPVIPERIHRLQLLPRPGSIARIAVLVGMALTAAAGSSFIIHWATSIGLAGEAAQVKNLQQEESQQGILLGGRPEIFVSSRAVMDSPILGHGSWAKDSKYVEMLNDIQVENGFQDVADPGAYGSGLIPTHSHLMSAWVYAGVLGAILWGYIFWLVLKSTVLVSNLRPPLAPIYAWLFVSYLWAIPFSPFGSSDRMIEAATIVIIMDLLEFRTSDIRMPQWLRRRAWRRMPPRARLLSRRAVGGSFGFK